MKTMDSQKNEASVGHLRHINDFKVVCVRTQAACGLKSTLIVDFWGFQTATVGFDHSGVAVPMSPCWVWLETLGHDDLRGGYHFTLTLTPELVFVSLYLLCPSVSAFCCSASHL